MIKTTKINTEYSYKITDELLKNNYIYNMINNNMCSYSKDNIKYIKEKIPYRHIYVYRFTEYEKDNVIKVYTKKSEVKKLLLHINENNM